MITIFCGFCQFFRQKLAFFSKINAPFFAQIFGKNIFKITTSVPGSCWTAGIAGKGHAEGSR
jgi:hypothetical protein